MTWFPNPLFLKINAIFKNSMYFFYNPYTAVSIFLIYVYLIGGPSAQPETLTAIPPESCLISGQYSAGFRSLRKLKIKPRAFTVCL